MHRIGAILNSRYGNLAKVIRIRDNWKEIAGEVLAAHTEPVQLKGKTLYILCDSPAWVQQIGFFSPKLQPRIKDMAKVRVNKIDGRFGTIHRSKPKTKAQRTFNRFDIDPKDVEMIKDPGLKKAVEDLIAVQGEKDG